MTKRFLFLIFITLLFIASNPDAAGATLSDEEKKTIVYEMYRNYKKHDFSVVQDIHPKQAMDLLKDKRIIFIDTRKDTEMDISMLPDSISKTTFLKNPEKYKDKIIVAYCTISYRSGKFAKEMQQKNIPIQNLVGGLLAWVLEGGKVYDQAGETKRIHVYGKKWDYPANGYKSVRYGFFERFFE
jgi:rhodanese-related sulfurtransferase